MPISRPPLSWSTHWDVGEGDSVESAATMSDDSRIGVRVRALRRAKGLSHARPAEEADTPAVKRRIGAVR
jgi:hypothetical protein